jgi:Uma2 family endonuclease
MLEIMAPSFEHETVKDTIAQLFLLFASEMRIDFIAAGSTTFRREDLEKGFEPDACFYMQHAKNVRGKKQIDLSVDPPPDLVIEIDITRSSLDKRRIYAAAGVPEVWHYAADTLKIFRLDSGTGTYVEEPHSPSLLHASSAALTEFLRSSQELTSDAWEQRVRDWIRKR